MMRAALRLLVCVLISCAVGLAAVPAQMPVPQIEKADCCAKANADGANHECDRHAPKSNDEKQCCAACAFGLALFFAPATSFIYPPAGDQSFAAFISTEHLRSERPPVPPPRV
jgi:hypothetical protein